MSRVQLKGANHTLPRNRNQWQRQNAGTFRYRCGLRILGRVSFGMDAVYIVIFAFGAMA